jgi:hypothetical protein
MFCRKRESTPYQVKDHVSLLDIEVISALHFFHSRTKHSTLAPCPFGSINFDLFILRVCIIRIYYSSSTFPFTGSDVGSQKQIPSRPSETNSQTPSLWISLLLLVTSLEGPSQPTSHQIDSTSSSGSLLVWTFEWIQSLTHYFSASCLSNLRSFSPLSHSKSIHGTCALNRPIPWLSSVQAMKTSWRPVQTDTKGRT